MKQIVRSNLISLFILIVVLSVPISFLLGIPMGYGIGKMSVISPLPMPFRDDRGFENYIYDRQGNIFYNELPIALEEQRHLREMFSHGPHKRKIPYTVAINWAPRLDTEWTEPVYQYIVCNQNFVETKANRIEINYINRRTGNQDFKIEYECK